ARSSRSTRWVTTTSCSDAWSPSTPTPTTTATARTRCSSTRACSAGSPPKVDVAGDDRTLPLAVGIDTFVVVLFVAVGLREHAQDSAFTNVIETALPFLIGLAAG